MKKITAWLLGSLMVLSFAACGKSGNDDAKIPLSGETAAPESTQESVVQPLDEAITDLPDEAPTELPAEAPDAETEGGEGKTLVVYYSATGHTESVAGYIAAATGADIFVLEPANPYSSADLNWTDENSRVVYEHDNPETRVVELVAATVEDWESYDTVFIGYPIWWGIAAWPVDGFIAANDFSGKTVVPFCTSSSSELGDSGKLLEEVAGTGEWLEGTRFSSRVSEETVREWVAGLGL